MSDLDEKIHREQEHLDIPSAVNPVRRLAGVADDPEHVVGLGQVEDRQPVEPFPAGAGIAVAARPGDAPGTRSLLSSRRIPTALIDAARRSGGGPSGSGAARVRWVRPCLWPEVQNHRCRGEGNISPAPRRVRASDLPDATRANISGTPAGIVFWIYVAVLIMLRLCNNPLI